MMHQKGIDLNHDFYVVVGKHCRTEMHTWVTNTISLYNLTNDLLFYFSVSYEIDKFC